MQISIYRYHPEQDNKPRMQTYEVEEQPGMMLREALLAIKEQ
ncbi:MAG: succinate dehydrogenase iron-sulfur subunit, partial [Thiohalocapsa sp.]